MKTSQAGTLESMDCLVTLEEAPAGAGVGIEISGASAARFTSAMEKKIREPSPRSERRTSTSQYRTTVRST